MNADEHDVMSTMTHFPAHFGWADSTVRGGGGEHGADDGEELAREEDAYLRQLVAKRMSGQAHESRAMEYRDDYYDDQLGYQHFKDDDDDAIVPPWNLAPSPDDASCQNPQQHSHHIDNPSNAEENPSKNSQDNPAGNSGGNQTPRVSFRTQDEIHLWDDQLDALRLDDDEFLQVAHFLMDILGVRFDIQDHQLDHPPDLQSNLQPNLHEDPHYGVRNNFKKVSQHSSPYCSKNASTKTVQHDQRSSSNHSPDQSPNYASNHASNHCPNHASNHSPNSDLYNSEMALLDQEMSESNSLEYTLDSGADSVHDREKAVWGARWRCAKTLDRSRIEWSRLKSKQDSPVLSPPLRDSVGTPSYCGTTNAVNEGKNCQTLPWWCNCNNDRKDTRHMTDDNSSNQNSPIETTNRPTPSTLQKKQSNNDTYQNRSPLYELTDQLIRNFEMALRYRMERVSPYPRPDDTDIVAKTRTIANYVQLYGLPKLQTDRMEDEENSLIHGPPKPSYPTKDSRRNKRHSGQKNDTHFFPLLPELNGDDDDDDDDAIDEDENNYNRLNQINPINFKNKSVKEDSEHKRSPHRNSKHNTSESIIPNALNPHLPSFLQPKVTYPDERQCQKRMAQIRRETDKIKRMDTATQNEAVKAACQTRLSKLEDERRFYQILNERHKIQSMLRTTEVDGVRLACKERLKHLKLELETLNLEDEDVIPRENEEENWYERVLKYVQPRFEKEPSLPTTIPEKSLQKQSDQLLDKQPDPSLDRCRDDSFEVSLGSSHDPPVRRGNVSPKRSQHSSPSSLRYYRDRPSESIRQDYNDYNYLHSQPGERVRGRKERRPRASPRVSPTTSPSTSPTTYSSRGRTQKERGEYYDYHRQGREGHDRPEQRFHSESVSSHDPRDHQSPNRTRYISRTSPDRSRDSRRKYDRLPHRRASPDRPTLSEDPTKHDENHRYHHNDSNCDRGSHSDPTVKSAPTTEITRLGCGQWCDTPKFGNRHLDERPAAVAAPPHELDGLFSYLVP